MTIDGRNSTSFRPIFWSFSLILLSCSLTFAQAVPPFIGGPVTVFDIEVGIIDSGALFDTQAAASNDRRSVTINARADHSSLLALQDFRTQATATGGSGFVGGFGSIGPSAAHTPRSSPSQIDRANRDAASILNRRGVYLLSPSK